MIDLPEVVIDPNRKKAERGEILVGLGNTREENEGLVLQHKTGKKSYRSLSRFVYEEAFDEVREEQEFRKIYLEDFSVDTVLSLWILLHMINSQELPKNLELWVDYADRWESGDTSSTGDAFHSYGVLQNALAQALSKDSPTWRLEKSFDFLDELFGHYIDPSAIPELDNQLYRIAIDFLDLEYANYEKMIAKAEIHLLELSMIDSEHRREVSAVFIEEPMNSSIYKVFLRQDSIHAPTGDGFGLMAVYDDRAIGTGNDIVISVDPAKKVHLRELWQALEAEEERLWQGKRPYEHPRPLRSYPEGNGPDEPWWDDMGRYTLIASPKRVGTTPGRKTEWKRVKELILNLYKKENGND
jgi:hypothetical protein